MGEATPPLSDDRYTVRSLLRAVEVLEALGTDAARRGLSVTEVSEATGLSKSATFAILHTLLAAGFVSDTGDGRSRRYHLGRALARLGARARSAVAVPDLARPVLDRLAQEIGHTVRLGRVDGAAVELVERIDAPSGIRIDLRMGDRELLHSTAIGKAVLATWPDDRVTEALGAGPYPARTPLTHTTWAELRADLDAIRSRGWAVDDEEDYPGIVCIGAAIPDDVTVWAISTTLVKATTDAAGIARLGATVAAAAAQVQARLT